MTVVRAHGVNVSSTRMLAHREGCASEIPVDAIRIDRPNPPRLSAGTWTVVVQGMDDCKIVARGCVEADLPIDGALTVMLEPVEPVDTCPDGACRAGQCVCETCEALECGSHDYAGYCDGDSLTWCDTRDERRGITDEDCALTGRICGWENDVRGFNCIGDAPLTMREIVGNVPYTIREAYGPTDDVDAHANDSREYCYQYGNPVDMHCGVDLSVPRGTPLYAPADAVVHRFAGTTGTFRDETEAPDTGDLRFKTSNGTIIIYGHTSRVDVEVGQHVQRGELIGASGSLDGPRLHLEVRVPDGSTLMGYRTEDPVMFFGR